MSKHADLYETAKAKGYDERMCCVIAEALDAMEKSDPKLYAQIVEGLEDIAYAIPQQEAEQIVRRMEPYGQNWSMSQVSDVLQAKGVDDNLVNYYLVMNMCYNDYYETASAFNLQKDTEFFFSLARDFIEDRDGKPHKVEKYFLEP